MEDIKIKNIVIFAKLTDGTVREVELLCNKETKLTVLQTIMLLNNPQQINLFPRDYSDSIEIRDDVDLTI